MKLKQFFIAGLNALATIPLVATITLARPAVLRANNPDARINVRTAPTVNSSSPSYGIPGDRVEILREVSGSDGFTWYYVEFNRSRVRGWIRGDFIQVGGRPTPPANWSKTYNCRDYTVTLSQVGCSERFTYRASGTSGNLFLQNGTRQNTGYAWLYTFSNGDTTYELMDAWANAEYPDGGAYLRVYRGDRVLLNRACEK